MRKGFLKSLSDSRKIKYSTLNGAFIALVIALVVVLNSIITTLSQTYNWYIDMTDEQMFSLSEQSKEILDGVNDEVQLEIVFPYDEDRVSGKFSTSATNGSIGYIHTTAEEIANACDNITISYHDVDRDYAFYQETGTLSKAGDNTIIVLRKDIYGNYVKGDFRAYPVNYFYVADQDGSLYGYNGELVFMSAILAMSNDTVPTVYFTVGHGELSFTGETSVDHFTAEGALRGGLLHADAFELIWLFCESGFTVKPLNLLTQDVPEDARMIVINEPQSDFHDDEIYKLNTYLRNEGAVFAFTPYNAELKGLFASFEQNYGVTVKPSATPVTDDSTKFDNMPNTLLASVSSHDSSFATKQYFGALKGYASAKARFNDTGALTINPEFMKTTGYQSGMAETRFTYPLLESSSNAVFNGTKGTSFLMSITAIEKFRQESGDSAFSYLVVCPSGEFASNDYLLSTSAPNKNMILSLVQSTSSVQTPVNLDYKTFMQYELDITDRQAQTATALLATILPICAVVCGVVVIVRRKHK